MAIVLHDNNITYNNVTLPGGITGQRRSNQEYIDAVTKYPATRRNTEEIDAPTERFINCIDIDWNSAQVTSIGSDGTTSTTSIGSTSELFAWVMNQINNIRTQYINKN